MLMDFYMFGEQFAKNRMCFLDQSKVKKILKL